MTPDYRQFYIRHLELMTRLDSYFFVIADTKSQGERNIFVTPLINWQPVLAFAQNMLGQTPNPHDNEYRNKCNYRLNG